MPIFSEALEVKFRLNQFILTASAAGVLALVGCSNGSSSTDSAVLSPTAKSVLPVAVQTVVQDAATSLPLVTTGTDKITVVVYGADASKVIDGDGKSLYNATGGFAGPLSSNNGIFTIYMQPGATTPAEMSLRLVANAKGYVTSSQELIIKNTDLNTDGNTSSFAVAISLISQTAPPPTVTTASTAAPLTNGKTASQITATTTESTVGTGVDTVQLGTAAVVIPATTTAYTDTAKTIALPAGTTELKVTYNNNTTGDSLAAFPGGLLTRQDPTGAALPSPGGFISGGLASVELISTAADGTQTKAKTFDQPISVTISIPQNTVNPETGLPVAQGDIIPIWSYDTVTGEWSVMKMLNDTLITGTLGALKVSDNTYPVTFTTDHLSYFNLDWFAWKTTIPGKRNVLQCDSAPITIKGAKGKPLYLEASMVGGGWMHPWNLDAGKSDPAIDKIIYAPKNLPMRIDAYLGVNKAVAAKKVGSVTVSDVCSGVTLDVTDGVNTLSPTLTYVNVDVQVQEVCSTDSTRFTNVPSVGVYAVLQGLPRVSSTTQTTGLATLKSLLAGKTYAISVTNRDGQSKQFNYSVLAANNAVQKVSFPVTCKPRPTGASGG